MEAVKRDLALREAKRLYPEINSVLAEWVYDYVQAIGEEEMTKRVEEGFYDAKPEEKVLCLENRNNE